MGGMVSNGRYGATAKLSVPNSVKEIRVPQLPENVQPTRGTKPGELTITYERCLGFYGHPPKPITSFTVKSSMGLAWRQTTSDETAPSGVLEIGTYGEWDSHIEGGASIVVLSVVHPPDVTVSQRADLSGENSAAASREMDATHMGYWYAARSPANGWTKL